MIPLGFFFRGAAAGDFEAIATATVPAGGTSTIAFYDAPGYYTHIQLRMVSRVSDAVTSQGSWVRPGGSSTTGFYTYHQQSSVGSGAPSQSGWGGTAASGIWGPVSSGASANASIFGASIIDLFDWDNSSNFETVLINSGVDFNTSGQGWRQLASGVIGVSNSMNLGSYFYLTLAPSSGTWSENTTVSLYGIKAS